jgi:hypothetical protein
MSSLLYRSLLLSLLPLSSVFAHLFTDDAGRQVEADLVGVRGEHVILARQGVMGLWPKSKLAAADQAYVADWQRSHTGVSKVSVRLFEREGLGEKGEFPETQTAAPSPPPGIPGLVRTEEKASHRHYTVDVTNTSSLDAGQLQVDYILYVMHPDGSVGARSASQTVPSLASGQRQSLTTLAISSVRTRTQALQISLNQGPLGNSISTRTKTSRSSERFGGAWVRVKGLDGSLLGEAQSLHPELAAQKPTWTGPTEQKEIPLIPGGLDGLLKLIQNLPKPPGASTQAPAATPPAGPGLPPLPGR